MKKHKASWPGGGRATSGGTAGGPEPGQVGPSPGLPVDSWEGSLNLSVFTFIRAGGAAGSYIEQVKCTEHLAQGQDPKEDQESW